MLTPVQIFISTAISAIIIQILTVNFTRINLEKDDLKLDDNPNIFNLNKMAITSTIQSPYCSPTPEPEPEVNKLLDAIFVTHAIEAEEPIKEQLLPAILDLNEHNFESVYANNWLILA